MAEPKTKPTNQDPRDFLNAIEDEQKRLDSLEILRMFEEVTGERAIMWGTSIVGFGMYHLKSEKSSQEADWPLAGFSPRKQNLTLYAMEGNENNQDLFEKLGKYTSSKACIYIKRLSDVDVQILRKLILTSYVHAKKTR